MKCVLNKGLSHWTLSCHFINIYRFDAHFVQQIPGKRYSWEYDTFHSQVELALSANNEFM
uniref:Uncharacterized protein n=1 Tax=Anguilla anguilla TaxID=7936 RepID=A0A0E9QIF2_ANGAN